MIWRTGRAGTRRGTAGPSSQGGRVLVAMLLMVGSAVIGWKALNDSVPEVITEWAEKEREGRAIGAASEVESVDANRMSSKQRPGCDPEEQGSTAVKNWIQGQGRLSAQSMRVTNMMGRAVFVEVVEKASGRVVTTMLVLPGESAEARMTTPTATVLLQTGEVWCGMASGWSDGQKLEVERSVELEAGRKGVEVVYVSPSKNGGAMKVGRAFMAEQAVVTTEEQRTGVEAEKVRKFERDEGVNTRGVDDRTARQDALPIRRAPAEQTESKWHRRQIELVQMRKERSEPEIDKVEAGQPRGRRAMAAAEAQAGFEPMELQDWRDLPNREIRVMTKGRIRMLTGSVGDEDVTFILSGSSMTTIGRDLAEAAGGSGCLAPKGGEGVWKGCLQVIPRISFGSVSLENVMVVVEPRVTVPVLGSDLIGKKMRLYQGKDGTYLRVGT